MYVARATGPAPHHHAATHSAQSDDSYSESTPADAEQLDQEIGQFDQEPGEKPLPAIRLDDGSKVLALGSSQVSLVEQTESEARFRLDTGKAWFDVKPSARTTVVRISDVRVQVVGTEFVVEKVGGEVFVWVQRGTATVTSEGEEVTLGENEQGRFPAHDAPSASADAVPALPTTTLSTSKRVRMQADALLESKSVIELWAMADSARLAGEISSAVDALDMLVTKHPGDARAPLAAFTLGRILLDSKSAPARAASAFEKARTLSPKAPLVEDALAREIESHWQAGAAGVAKQRTELYERLFPHGRHIERNRKQR
jgi:transmembrane sensor